MESPVLTGPVITFLWESAEVLRLPARPSITSNSLFMGQRNGPEGVRARWRGGESESAGRGGGGGREREIG